MEWAFNSDTEDMNIAMVSSCDKQLVTCTFVYILVQIS